MNLFIEKNKVYVQCHYHEKDLVKAIGGYRYVKARQLWEFPLYKLLDITKHLKVDYDNTVDKAIIKLKREQVLYQSALMASEGIKNDLPYAQIPYHIEEDKQLFTHQKQALGLLGLFDAYALFMELGTGKSFVAIKDIECNEKPAMVVAPLSTLNSVWLQEIQKWSKLKTLNLWSYIKRYGVDIPDGYDVYLINFESFKKLRTNDIKNKIKYLVIDESSKLKNPKSAISKFVLSLRHDIPRRLILSGLPAPNSILEYWPQLAFINDRLLGDNFFRFRNSYFYSYGYGGYQYNCTEDSRKKIMENVAKQSFYIRKEECLSLPDRITEYRTIQMDDIQAEAYKTMKKENVMLYKDKVILSSNELAKLMKLRELTSGFCISNEGLPVKISETKFNLLKDIVSNEIAPDRQIIIWCNFHFEIKYLMELFKDQAVAVYGEVKQKDKERNIETFKSGKVRILIAHPKSASMGLTFTNCNYMIWFSLSYSYEEHTQANDRIYRIGQKNKCTYLYLLAEDTIDEVIYKALTKKKKVADACLQMLKGENA